MARDPLSPAPALKKQGDATGFSGPSAVLGSKGGARSTGRCFAALAASYIGLRPVPQLDRFPLPSTVRLKWLLASSIERRKDRNMKQYC